MLVSATTFEAFLETDLIEEEEEEEEEEEDRDGKGPDWGKAMMRLLLPQKKCEDRWKGEI